MGIKLANIDELQWVNEQYQNIGFIPSNLENETVAIVMHYDQYAGVGRIVYLNEKEAEIGGIYILDEFRGLSLANELVGFLVKEATRSNLKWVYCLPFEELKHFYEKFGFTEIDHEETINSLILKKHQWCKEKYEKRVLLLKYNPS